jgi:cytochrome P450
MDRCLATKSDRPDFETYLFRQNDAKALGPKELHSEILILVGGRAIATALSGCLYYLCLNPEVMHRLTNLIRTNMVEEENIANILELTLEYPVAVLDKTMRIYPSVPRDLQTVAPCGVQRFAVSSFQRQEASHSLHAPNVQYPH